MQFVVVAYDDPHGGLERRLAAREAHVKMGDAMKAKGNYLMGVAILDDKEQMTGSIMILDFPSKKKVK